MNAYNIKTMIEEDVRCDIHGDLYGHERVAEHLAERFEYLQERIDALKEVNEHLQNEVNRLKSLYEV